MRGLKGQKVEAAIETRINLPIEAYLPDTYIPDSRQKISIYKKISALKTDADRHELEDELKDRYGDIPEPVEMLLEISSIKQLCQQLGITTLVAGSKQLKATFDERKSSIDVTQLVETVHNNPKLQLRPPAQLMIDIEGLGGRNLLIALQQILTPFVAAD